MVSTEEERRKKFNEYRQDELQLLGTIQPGGDELPDLEYTPTTPEEEVMEGTEQTGEVQQQTGEEGQHGEEQEGSEEHYPTPSDAGDSDDRGRFGDNHIPRVLGDWTPEEEMELVLGTREQQEEALREIREHDRQRRVATWRMQMLEASTTPTSLEEPSFSSNMVDELRQGVDPHARIVVEAAMEASNLALNTNGDDLEVMMRIVRDTAMKAFDDERTPRQRLRIWRQRFRARLEGCGVWQRYRSRDERKIEVENYKEDAIYNTKEPYYKEGGRTRRRRVRRRRN